MISTSRPVPSKDALRALRSLAFSPSTAVWGTIGGVCSLVAAHYQSCHSLRHAEQIVATKRALHTISKGRGLQQLTLMIEAAERGDDFTLHHGRPMKSQKRGASTMVAQQGLEDITFPPSVNESTQNNRRFGKPRIPTSSSLRTKPSSHARSSLDNETNITQRSKRLTRQERLSMKPRNYRDATIMAVKMRQARRWQMMMNVKLEARSRLRSGPQIPQEQDVTDLHPSLPDGELDEGAISSKIPSLSPEESIFFNFVFGKQSHDEIYESSVFKQMHPWNELRELESTSSNQYLATKVTVSNDSLPPPMAGDEDTNTQYIAFGALVPEKVFSHGLTTRYTQSRRDSLRLAHADSARYFHAFNTIAQTIHDSGRSLGFDCFKQILLSYTQTKHRADDVLAKLLILEFTAYFDSKTVMALARNIVRKHLEGKQPHLYSVGLLYPYFGGTNEVPSNHASYPAMRYLEDFVDRNPDLEAQQAELLKIIKGTFLCKLALSEQLVLPLIRPLCAGGKVNQAQRLVDEMLEKYNIQPTLYTLVELMRGYASIGNWWKVKSILDQSHADGMSWKKVHGHAGLFACSLEQFMAKHTLEQSCAFVMHNIQESGLFPTSTISTCIITGCIREKRYDLLRQYINMVQRDFPFLDLGITRAPFASAVAAAWKDIRASTADIFEGCKAIAVNAVRDPFSTALRGVISEAVARDLVSQIEALERQGTFKAPELEQRPSVRAYVESIRALVKHHHQVGFTTETRSLAAKLVQNTKIVMELQSLLNGSYTADRTTGEDEEEEEEEERKIPTKAIQTNSAALPRMPPGLKAQRLPHIKEIIAMLQKFYESRHNRGLDVDHAVTQNVCSRLTQQSRYSDAYILMEAVYRSEWAQHPNGKPLNIDHFVQWLRLGLRLKSGSKVKDVLWAVAESGPTLEVSNELLLAARIALPRTHFALHKAAQAHVLGEAEYLQARLRWRRSQELTRKEKKPMVFATWTNMGSA